MHPWYSCLQLSHINRCITSAADLAAFHKYVLLRASCQIPQRTLYVTATCDGSLDTKWWNVIMNIHSCTLKLTFHLMMCLLIFLLRSPLARTKVEAFLYHTHFKLPLHWMSETNTAHSDRLVCFKDLCSACKNSEYCYFWYIKYILMII